MVDDVSDFLEVGEKHFENHQQLANHINQKYTSGSIKGEFNIIGAINNLGHTDGVEDSKQHFMDLLADEFQMLHSSGDLYRIFTTVDDDPMYSYVWADSDAPIFLTTANKTDQIPQTIQRFLHTKHGVGRLMLSKREVDGIRKSLSSRFDNLVVPYFSARRSRDSLIGAQRRPNVDRSIQYRAIDGLATYREMRYNYGILPQIMTFKLPGMFKFRVKSDGTFVHQHGTFHQVWDAFQNQIERVNAMKECANTGGFTANQTSRFREEGFSISTPWGIQVEKGIDASHIETLPEQLEDDFWEFSLSEYYVNPESDIFDAELIDDTTRERTTMKTRGNQIRIFPRELTDIDQSIRLFNFVSDHFESDCTPVKIV
ncbi:hypothetical protein [Halomarina rubra]|uniref:Uncharacterized protein n=1 Tax=Halomarina rubra TaxID=2071873 RepID=A0ABD6ASY7_9EURY|nr:hypothetical protein [Halomarina rubra]